MATAIADLLVALKEWQSAIQQFKQKGKSWKAKEQQLAHAEQHVLRCLESEAVAVQIEALIQQAIAAPSLTAEDIRTSLIKDADPLLTIELRTVHPLAISRKDLEKVIVAFLKTPDIDQPITSLEELKQAFFRLSATLPRAYRESINLSRKPKKVRRRDLSMGTLQTAIGIGLVAGNTQMDSTVAGSSYILGGNAILTALQNFVGHLEVNPQPNPTAISDAAEQEEA